MGGGLLEAVLPVRYSHATGQPPAAHLNILLGPEYYFTQAPPCTFCRGMGSGNSRREENLVADVVDKSHISTRDFTVLKLHGNTGALIAGSLATLLLLYAAYRVVLWRRARMARVEEERGVPMGVGLGRLAQREAPLRNARGLCDGCIEHGQHEHEQRDILHGHFQPV